MKGLPTFKLGLFLPKWYFGLHFTHTVPTCIKDGIWLSKSVRTWPMDMCRQATSEFEQKTQLKTNISLILDVKCPEKADDTLSSPGKNSSGDGKFPWQKSKAFSPCNPTHSPNTCKSGVILNSLLLHHPKVSLWVTLRFHCPACRAQPHSSSVPSALFPTPVLQGYQAQSAQALCHHIEHRSRGPHGNVLPRGLAHL